MALSLILADVGTPLMFLGCGHLLFLNLLIGLGEGQLLAWWGRVRFARAAWIMIGANYTSGLVGVLLLPNLLSLLTTSWPGDAPLYRAGSTLAWLALVAFGLTVLIELPFVWWVLCGSARGRWSRLGSAVWVQAASYAVLAMLYLAVSPMTVLTQCTRVHDVAGLAGGSKGWVYYADPGAMTMRRVRLDGTGGEKVCALPASAEVNDRWRGFWGRTEQDGSVTLMVATILPGNSEVVCSGIVGSLGDRGTNQASDIPARMWPVDFRPEDARPDYYLADPFAEGGLQLHEWYTDSSSQRWTRTTLRVNFANPLWMWDVGFPTILPGGQVVFEFGAQIVVMDRQRRIGVLAMGRSPVVVMDSPVPAR